MSLFHLTVPTHQSVVEYRHGALLRVLGPGRHRRRRGVLRHAVDRRESLLALAPQEVLTADGVSVRVSATLRWAVVDPVAWLERSSDPGGTVYLAAQVALREALAGLGAEELGRRGAALPLGSLTAAVDAVAREVGIEVREVVVKDVVLPGELRSAALELVAARSRGAAQLEAARAESAALRSLANGARLLESHPALARIRLVQSAPPGSTVVLRLDGPDDVGTVAAGEG
ncbi:SPFH domain-containing protein [Phycicoccus duodecadis]|uniref:SPFH domain/Band 7 family protein n=1 Tax=Phycicoccus duodecadis TaxID=173053 RepID=A0A2N3YM44_9MICO|nr:SPFH domain-containing protein [Phycicoccus duodecadis]PKW27912.1 SPFH domain/Band 7 family protein [Phycicoccus duodecadis]